jgi:uncharacterized protein YceK
MRIRTLVIFLTLGLSGCGSIFSPDPIGIGRDRDELKQSPCACDEIHQNYDAWILPG